MGNQLGGFVDTRQRARPDAHRGDAVIRFALRGDVLKVPEERATEQVKCLRSGRRVSVPNRPESKSPVTERHPVSFAVQAGA